MNRVWLTVALFAVEALFLSTQAFASSLFELIDSACISTAYPNLPDAKKIRDAGFTQVQAIPPHPSGAWNTADQGWPIVFGQKGIHFRFREESKTINGEKFDGFVCEVIEAGEQIEELKKEMFVHHGEPQSSILGDGYEEHYWSLGKVPGERREVEIDTLSHSLKYFSYKKRD